MKKAFNDDFNSLPEQLSVRYFALEESVEKRSSSGVSASLSAENFDLETSSKR